jgi:hypothetical protein
LVCFNLTLDNLLVIRSSFGHDTLNNGDIAFAASDIDISLHQSDKSLKNQFLEQTAVIIRFLFLLPDKSKP